MNMIRRLASVVAAMFAGVAFGATDSVYEVDNGWGSVDKIYYNSKGDVERGEWTSQFNKAFELAQNEGVPLMVFWGNDGCGHCAALESEMSGSTFTKWQKEYGIYMTFNIGGYSGPAGRDPDVWDAKSAAFDASGEFPYIGVWWVDSKGEMKQLGTFTGNGLSADNVISKVKSMLKGYSPNKGGRFAVPYKDETDGHRYEAFVSAEVAATVKIPLIRDEKDANSTGEDTIVISGPDGKQMSKKTITWAKGDVKKTLSVSIPAGTFSKAGQKIRAVINGKSSNDDVYKTIIFAVDDANTVTNPDYEGCKAFGRWTMDLKAAKAYAEANDGLVLVSVQGSQWCPDCANVERNFLSLEKDGKNRFQTWAKEKKLALVSIDIPNFDAAKVECKSPCLLKADPYSKALARASEYPASGASEDDLTPIMRSGLGYLTRNGISESQAEETLKRNWNLARKNTSAGGFHRPEDGNVNRTGVPIFVLLRKEGTVAARLTRMAAESPMKADQKNFDNYLKRFEEMMTIAANDATEIENNYLSADSIDVTIGGSAKGQISNTDTQDSFRFIGVGGNTRVKATISGSSNAKVLAQFVFKDADGNIDEREPKEVVISEGATVSADFTKSGKCFLIVKAADITSEDFKLESSTSQHFTDFTVTAEQALAIPQEAKTELLVSGESTKIKVVSGQKYRITGLGETDASKLEKTGDNIYTARVSDFVTVPVAKSGTTIAYQTWNPGKVAFASATDTIQESAGSWKVKVTRSGASGDCTVRVRLNLAKTDYFYDWEEKTLPRFDVNGKWPFEYVDLLWKDGDKATKTVTVNLDGTIALLKKYYGDGQIVFDLEAIGTAELGSTTCYTLKVKEDQNPTPSTIALAKANPGIILTRKVYARESSTVKLRITRDGSYSAGHVQLDSSSSSVKIVGDGYSPDTGILAWADRDDDDRVLEVSNLPKGGSSVKIAISPSEIADVAKWFKVDSDAKYVKIMSIADDAPEFESTSVSLTVARYVSVSDTIAFNPSYIKGGTLGVDRLSGALPDGLTAKVVDGKLTFAGAATAKQQSYTVYFQPTETLNGKKVVGIPIKITIKVIDPVKINPKHETYGMYSNPAVAKNRLLNGLMVFARSKPSRLAGTIRIYIPASGKISAKYMCQGGTIAFSASNWSEILTKSRTLSFGTIPAGTLVSHPLLTTDKTGYGLYLYVMPDGRVAIDVMDPNYKDEDCDLGAYSDGKVWSADNSADAWRGIYNATLVPGGTEYYPGEGAKYKQLSGSINQPANKEAYAPHGSGYISFTMTDDDDCNAGKMLWAGQLPGGQKVSGSVVLTRGLKGWIGRTGYAYVPIYYKTSTDRFSVVAEIQKDAARRGLSRVLIGSPDFAAKEIADMPLGFWKHAEKTSGAKTTFSMDLHLFGSYYDPKKSLLKCCEESFADPEQILKIDNVEKAGYDPDLEERGSMKVIMPLNIDVGEDDISITSKSNPKDVTLSFNRETGLITGTFQLDYKFRDGTQSSTKAYWRGVLLTGWGEECACGDGIASGVYLPFICGGYYFNDKVPYANGSETITVKGGGFAFSGERD